MHKLQIFSRLLRKHGNDSPEKLLSNRLIRLDEFLLDKEFKDTPLPSKPNLFGKRHYRYIDRIFSPIPINKLTSIQSKKLCDIRLTYFDNVVDDTYNISLIDCLLYNIDFDCNTAINILDFGCGNGAYTKKLKHRFLKSNIYGVDISMKAINFAKKDTNSIKFIHINEKRKLPFSDNFFDVIISSFVMHFDIDMNIISELKRIIKPNGKFVFNIFNKKYFDKSLFTKMENAGFRLEIVSNCNLSNANMNICATIKDKS